MQSDATTVTKYLKELETDRRKTISTVRNMILKNLAKGFKEVMQCGMIGYVVPHSLYPAGYHCNPEQPLPFINLASQKNYCSLYAMSLYSDATQLKQFQTDWKLTGKKLNMGKSCIRFKQADDLPLELIASHIRSVSVADYIANYERIIGRSC